MAKSAKEHREVVYGQQAKQFLDETKPIIDKALKNRFDRSKKVIELPSDDIEELEETNKTDDYISRDEWIRKEYI